MRDFQTSDVFVNRINAVKMINANLHSVCDYAYLKTTTTNTLPTETAATTETITVETAVEETSGCAV